MIESKKGITYNADDMINNKLLVYVVDDNFQPTGEKLLCSPEKLSLIGFVD